jgi:MutL C terminal dimerisation domain
MHTLAKTARARAPSVASGAFANDGLCLACRPSAGRQSLLATAMRSRSRAGSGPSTQSSVGQPTLEARLDAAADASAKDATAPLQQRKLDPEIADVSAAGTPEVDHAGPAGNVSIASDAGLHVTGVASAEAAKPASSPAAAQLDDEPAVVDPKEPVSRDNSAEDPAVGPLAAAADAHASPTDASGDVQEVWDADPLGKQPNAVQLVQGAEDVAGGGAAEGSSIEIDAEPLVDTASKQKQPAPRTPSHGALAKALSAPHGARDKPGAAATPDRPGSNAATGAAAVPGTQQASPLVIGDSPGPSERPTARVVTSGLRFRSPGKPDRVLWQGGGLSAARAQAPGLSPRARNDALALRDDAGADTPAERASADAICSELEQQGPDVAEQPGGAPASSEHEAGDVATGDGLAEPGAKRGASRQFQDGAEASDAAAAAAGSRGQAALDSGRSKCSAAEQAEQLSDGSDFDLGAEARDSDASSTSLEAEDAEAAAADVVSGAARDRSGAGDKAAPRPHERRRSGDSLADLVKAQPAAAVFKAGAAPASGTDTRPASGHTKFDELAAATPGAHEVAGVGVLHVDVAGMRARREAARAAAAARKRNVTATAAFKAASLKVRLHLVYGCVSAALVSTVLLCTHSHMPGAHAACRCKPARGQHLIAIVRPQPLAADSSAKSNGDAASNGAGADDAATSELERVFRKRDFLAMKVHGQFNLGFIVASVGRDVFVVDQHAADEKFNFERLRDTTVLNKCAAWLVVFCYAVLQVSSRPCLPCVEPHAACKVRLLSSMSCACAVPSGAVANPAPVEMFAALACKHTCAAVSRSSHACSTAAAHMQATAHRAPRPVALRDR